jgi:hypothetical protein
VAYSIYNIQEKRRRKTEIKKIICKKNGMKEKQVTGVHRHTQERIEKIFFWI